MGKNIVLLSDGTGNSAAKLQKTNVWRIYRALDLSSDSQLAEYDDGVGTSSLRPLALIGSGFGVGLARNVRHLYAFLSRNYRDLPGSEKEKVFAFGFSRGAYTIRMLIGFVRNQGLVDPLLPEQLFRREVLRRWDAFRSERFRRLRRSPGESKHLDVVKKEGLVPKFEFVGLWDTVSAYGLPIDELQYAIDLYLYPFSFSDRRVCDIVKCAYHALSLDDERRTFHPVLWDESHAGDRARLQQVWFPGVHSNVGGGYPKDGLAYVSLEWMVRKAKFLGLRFIDADFNEIVQQVDAHDNLYNSRAGLGGYYRYSPRPVTTLGHDTFNGVTVGRPKVHESVFARIHRGQVAYAPIGVPPRYDLVLRDGTIIQGPSDAVRDASGETEAPIEPSDAVNGETEVPIGDASGKSEVPIEPSDAVGDASGKTEVLVGDASGETEAPIELSDAVRDASGKPEVLVGDASGETEAPIEPSDAVRETEVPIGDASGKSEVPIEPSDAVGDASGKTEVLVGDASGETEAPIEPSDAVRDASGKTEVLVTKIPREPTSRYLEDRDRAQLRAERMEAVWNIVWWRRVVYFLTLFSSLYLVGLPFFDHALSTRELLPRLTQWLADYLKPILKVAGYLVPTGVEETWLVTFRDEPVLFSIGLVCVAVTMLIGLSLEETIRSRAGEIWHPTWREVPKWAQEPKSTWLYKLRSNLTVIRTYRYFAWRVLPTVFLLVCAGITVWLLWEYPDYVTIYAILIVLAVAVRSWIFRAQYTAEKKMSRSADASLRRGGDRTDGPRAGAKKAG